MQEVSSKVLYISTHALPSLTYWCVIGTNVQKKMNNLRTLKQAQLRRKHATYVRLAREYNDRFTPGTLLATPSLQEVEGMELGDPFLNFGGLIHSNEPWAVDDATQEGIQAYIDVCRCTEELRRIAKEARQMMNWALGFQKKIDILRQDTINGLSMFPSYPLSKNVTDKCMLQILFLRGQLRMSCWQSHHLCLA
jgi:hypothetical protein